MTLPLAFNGNQITIRAERISLTDMWRAAGSPENREPFNWARFEGRRFIEAAQEFLNLSETQVLISKPGRRGGGTWAHWQVALTYAKYLSPEFHIWCNTVIRDRMESLPDAAASTVADIEAHARSVIGGIVKGIIHKEIAAVVPSMVQAELAGDRNRLVVDNLTLGEVLDAAGVASKGRRGLVNRVSRGLAKFSASEGQVPRRTHAGRGGVCVYSPEMVQRWLSVTGRAVIAEHRVDRTVTHDMFASFTATQVKP